MLRILFVLFLQKAAYELRISDWSSDVCSSDLGNPDGATPPHIVEKLVTVAQREDTHGYSTSKGIPRLRRAISRWYKDRYEVDIDPETEAIEIGTASCMERVCQ